MKSQSWSDLYKKIPPVVAGGGYRDLIVGLNGAVDIDRSMAGELIAVHPGSPADTPLKFSTEKGGATPETANDAIFVIVFIPDIIGQSEPDTKIPLQGLFTIGGDSDDAEFLTPGTMLYIVNHPAQGWIVHYRMVNMPTDDPGDTQPKIDGVELMARSGTQSPFDLDTVDVNALNAITSRTNNNGRLNYVGPLGKTGLGYYAPPGAKMAIRGEEIMFTPETLHGNPVYFVPDPDANPPVEIHGVAIQSSGYFRLLAPRESMLEQEPFSAIELDEGHNTGTVGDGQVYPPGGYIFHLDGTVPVGIDMLDRYTLASGVNLEQPAGYKSIFIELYRTGVPDLYMALYSGDNVQLINLDKPEEPLDNTSGFDPQGILTVDRLRTILINIFSAASKDPTGEGYVYLPWKYERWYRKEQGTPDWNLSTADVAKINAAPRTTNPENGIDNYVGTFVTAPGNVLLKPALGLYLAAGINLVKSNNADGSSAIEMKFDPKDQKDTTMMVLSGSRDTFGVMDVYISAVTPFSFRFVKPDNPLEILGLKVVRAFDPITKNTILLIDDKNYSMEDSIFPAGDYIFRPYEKAGFVLTILATTNLPEARPQMGAAGVKITRLRQTTGRDYYNAWFETAGVPKIVNSVDPKDQPETLEGLIQSEPAELEDVKGLESNLATEIVRLEGLIKNSAIWKVETWVGQGYMPRPFVGTTVASGSSIDLGNGITVHSFSRGNESFQITNAGLLYTDANRLVSDKTLFLQQKTAPYLGRVEIKPSYPFKLIFYKSNDPSNKVVPYDGDTIVVVDSKGVPLTKAAATDYIMAGLYAIRMSVPVDIAISYGQVTPLPIGGKSTIEIIDPGLPATVPFSVIYGIDGKIISVISTTDNEDRRSDTTGLTRVPTLIEQEIDTEPGITSDQLAADLRAQIDQLVRSVGVDDLGNSGSAFTVDWSKGKVKKTLNIDTSPVTITFVDPKYKEELFLYLTTALSKEPTVKFAKSIKGVKTSGGALEDPPTKDKAVAFHFFFDGTNYTDFGKS